MARPAPKKTAAPSGPEVVKASWLLKALGAILLVALVCSYLSLCLLFYQGQWQIVLHPSITPTTNAPLPGLLRFAPDESGRPQLTGEWSAAGEGGRYGRWTILLLASGDGSRQDAAETIHQLQDLGLNIFSFDYRGYGASGHIHPNQQRMTEDADAAWRYLTISRRVPENTIIPYGIGVGASLATGLAEKHSAVPALILDQAAGDLLETARRDPRSRLVPTGLLFKERFALAAPLSALKAPKLLITRDSRTISSYRAAANPKMTIELPGSESQPFSDAVRRFLDQDAVR